MGVLPGIGGLLGKSAPVTNFTYVAMASSASSTVNIPVSALPGDLVVLFQVAAEITNPAIKVTPAGFTNAVVGPSVEMGTVNIRADIDIRVIGDGEAGSAVVGANSGYENRKMLLVFRPNNPISNLAFLDPASEIGQPAPALQDIAVVAPAPPVLVLGHAFADAGVPNISGTLVTNGVALSGSNARHRVVYEIQGTTPQSRTWSMNDQGRNCLQSLGIYAT